MNTEEIKRQESIITDFINWLTEHKKEYSNTLMFIDLLTYLNSLESEEEVKCLINKCNNIFIYKDGYCRRCYDLLKDYQ